MYVIVCVPVWLIYRHSSFLFLASNMVTHVPVLLTSLNNILNAVSNTVEHSVCVDVPVTISGLP